MESLSAKNLTLGFGNRIIIDKLDISIPKGEITVLIGPNGSGKSTLLRSLARLLKPKEGSVILNGQNIARMRTKEVAQNMAILPQAPASPEGLTVYELVKQGRHPYRKIMNQWSREDERAVQKALHDTNMTELMHQSVDSLSGGQRQRAWIALTLAQDTDIILLDEPTTYLDLMHQIDVLDLLFELNEKDGRTIVMVLHDLNLATAMLTTSLPSKTKKFTLRASPRTPLQVNLLAKYSACAAILPVIRSLVRLCASRTEEGIVCLRKWKIIRYPPCLKHFKKIFKPPYIPWYPVVFWFNESQMKALLLD